MAKYYENGEIVFTGIDEELEQKRIDDEERLRILENVVKDIQDVTKNSDDLTIEEYKDLVGEIKWMIEDL